MSRTNVLWMIDHVCYDGSLHGGGRLYWNLLPRFDSEQFRVVPCLMRADDEIREVFERSPVPVRILDKGKFDVTALMSFLRLLREEEIDVMHLHCYAASSFGRLASVLTGVPAIIHDYDTEVYFPYPRYLSVADRLLAKSTYGAIGASPMVRRFLIDRRKIDPSRIELLFHAIPDEKFGGVPDAESAAIRSDAGIPADAVVCGTVTKLGPQRGNDFFVRAAAEACREVPNLHVLLAYKPTRFHRLPSKEYVPVADEETDRQRDELAALAEELGAGDRIHLVEWEGEPDAWVAACDVFVAPFLSERFSSVQILEALALGKPVVASDLGEQSEILKDGRDGYLVSPGDIEELAGRLVQLAGSVSERDRMAAGARETAKRYSVAAGVERLQAIYREAAAAHPRRRS